MAIKSKFKLSRKAENAYKIKFLKIISIITLLAFLNCMTGCTLFRVVNENDYTAKRLSQLNDEKKYFILHAEHNAWHFYDLKIERDTMYGKLDSYLGYHLKYLTPKRELNHYNKSKNKDVIKEVHIYTLDSIPFYNKTLSIPISSIRGIKIYEPAKSASTLRTIGAGFFGVIMLGIMIFFMSGGIDLGHPWDFGNWN